jgi:ribosomal protein S17E
MDNKDYNTKRNMIILPDYGRNIQKMVEHIATIESKEDRNKAALTIANIMTSMSSANSRENSADLKHRIWSQLAIMSGFKLDIDYPIETPLPENYEEKAKKLPLPQSNIMFRHYGKTVEKMVEKASEMEEGEAKQFLIKSIANHMKKLYLLWNREGIEDEQIFADIKDMADGKLIIAENFKLVETRTFSQPKKMIRKPTRK